MALADRGIARSWRHPGGGDLCVVCVCVCVLVCVYTHTHTHTGHATDSERPSIQYVHTHTHTQGMRQTVSEPSTQSTRAPTRAETLAGKPLLSGMEYFCTILLLLLCMEGSQESGRSSHVSADRYGVRVYVIIIIIIVLYGELAGERAE